MNEPQSTTDVHTSRYEYEDSWTVAVDLGAEITTADVAVDRVGKTAVVSLETPTLTTELDVALPETECQSRVKNGVLVIEGPGAEPLSSE